MRNLSGRKNVHSPYDTFVLRQGAFRREQEVPGKAAYHFFPWSPVRHFYDADAAFPRETRRLALCLMPDLLVCAEMFCLPWLLPPAIQAARAAEWRQQNGATVIESNLHGNRKKLLLSQSAIASWNRFIPAEEADSPWEQGVIADYYGAPAWTEDIACSGYEEAKQRVQSEASIALVSDDTHAVWTILTGEHYPYGMLKDRLQDFCESAPAVLRMNC